MSLVDDELAQLEILRAAKLIGAYLECSDAVQAGIRDMIAILNDPSTDRDDREMAIATLADAVFPSLHKGQLGVDLEESERDEAAEDARLRQMVQRMDAEEAAFAERLRSLMAQRHITQGQLAARIGVGQPAISNMLNRQCRPQRRTVLRLAEALEVEPAELWPEST